MHLKIIALLFFLFLTGCTSFRKDSAPNPRHTPEEATKYVHWWAENVRPSKRDVFEAALQGDHDALRRILNDTDNSFGPPNQDGDSASVLSGAFLVALGDEAFAEFIRNESHAVKNSVFGSFIHGPWSLAYDAYTVPAVAESKFSRMFPRTAKIRSQFYADNSIRAQAAPSNR